MMQSLIPDRGFGRDVRGNRILNSGTSYQQTGYLMKKYFSDLYISREINYDEHYKNYILYSTDKTINDEILFSKINPATVMIPVSYRT